jgi:CheY-specific phosphatase CheX
MPTRKILWQKLSGNWKPDNLKLIAKTVKLHDLQTHIKAILTGQIRGRILVNMTG